MNPEVIERVKAKLGHQSTRRTEQLVEAIFDAIRKALARGERVDIRGFGSFQIRTHKAHVARLRGKEIPIPERKMPFFRAGKDILERLQKRG